MKAIDRVEALLAKGCYVTTADDLRVIIAAAKRVAELEARIAESRAELKRGLDGFAGLRDVAQWAYTHLAPRTKPRKGKR